MLNQMTWSVFIALLLGAAAVYYLIVLGLYYVPHWRARQPELADHAALFEAPELPDEELVLAEDPAVRDIDGLILDIKSVADGGGADIPGQLQKIFHAYGSLRDSPHRPAINELVVSECEKCGHQGLTEDEVDRCWN